MSRKEYMEQLDMLLRDVPHTERQEALKYYEDYFEDAGEEHEAEVIEELGSPEELAKKLREDLKREEGERVSVLQERLKGENEEKKAEENRGNYQQAPPVQQVKPRSGNKGLTVFFIVLGVLIGLGKLADLTGGLFWAFRPGSYYVLEETEVLGETEEDNNMTRETYEVYKAGREEGVRNLNIEAGIGDLIIESGGGDEISVSYPEAYMNVQQEDEVLSIQTKKNWFWPWRRLIGIFDDKHNPYQIRITVPQDYIFHDVNISTGAGTADIERLTADSMFLKTGAGELNAGKLYVMEGITVEAGVGETVIQWLLASGADLSVGVGNLDIKGRILGNISAECGVGEITMELENREADYNFDVSCGVGEVSVNGKQYSGIGRSHNEDNSALFDFDMSCGVGEIAVTFIDGR